MVTDGKSAEQNYREYVNFQTALVGAFPIASDLQLSPAPRNLADATNLPAGAYTITVHSECNASGEVLVEIYQVPESP